MNTLLDQIDVINVNSLHASTDVMLSLINSYSKYAIMLEYCDDTTEIHDIFMESKNETNKEGVLKKILRVLKDLIRKFVRTVRSLLSKTFVARKLQKAVENYRRKKHDIPAIPPGSRRMKQNGTFNGENIAIEIDFEKSVIYSFVMLEKGHTPTPKSHEECVYSIENFIDIMNRLLDRWLWMVDDEDEAFDRILKYYADSSVPPYPQIPGIPDQSGHWNGKRSPDMEGYHFTNGYYDFWGVHKLKGRDKGASKEDIMEARTPIDIEEFSERYNEISKEYDAVVKRADEFCNKLEKLMQNTIAKDDIDFNLGVGKAYKGLMNYDIYERLRLVKGKKYTDKDYEIIDALKHLSAQFAYPMSALVDGYMILRTEANALAEGLIRFNEAVIASANK